MSIRNLINILILGLVVVSVPAFAADNVSEAIAWWKVMLNAIFSFIMYLCAFAGVVLIIGGGASWWMLATNRAPQRLQEVGMKGVFISLAIGASGIALAWIINMLVGTVAEGASTNSGEIHELLNQSSVPHYDLRIEQNERTA